MGSHKSTELGRFNALCREHGVTIRAGRCNGSEAPRTGKGGAEAGKSHARPWQMESWPLDCCKFAELYNLGCNNQEIADGLRMNVKAVHKRMKMLGLPGNRTQGGKKVRNPEVTPEQLYDRAEAVGMPAVLTEA